MKKTDRWGGCCQSEDVVLADGVHILLQAALTAINGHVWKKATLSAKVCFAGYAISAIT